MKRSWTIALLAVCIGIVAFIMWQPSTDRRQQWIESTLTELSSLDPPPSDHWTVTTDQWGGGDYLVFSNGWAGFRYHTFHGDRGVDDPRGIGDVAIIRAPDGVTYLSPHHFCVGPKEYFEHPRPADISEFIDRYSVTQRWTRIAATKPVEPTGYAVLCHDRIEDGHQP